jgi:hypothetical protein
MGIFAFEINKSDLPHGLFFHWDSARAITQAIAWVCGVLEPTLALLVAEAYAMIAPFLESCKKAVREGCAGYAQ